MLGSLVARAECTAQNPCAVNKACIFENLGAIYDKVENLILLLKEKIRLSLMYEMLTLNSFKVGKNLESLK